MIKNALLRDHKLTVDLQILDNDASVEYTQVIKNKWKINYHLLHPNSYRSNAAERAIFTFKAHFISILAGIVPDFPWNLWDLLLPQTEVTLNLIKQATIDPSRSAWAYFHVPFNCGVAPLEPLGCNIIYHKKMGTRNSSEFCGTAGWNLGVALQHYQMVDTRLHLLHCHNIHRHCSRIFQYFDFEK